MFYFSESFDFCLQTSRVVALCAYKDMSSLFSTETSTSYTHVHSDVLTSSADDDMAPMSSDQLPTAAKIESVDDEDELLYGDSNVSMTSETDTDGAPRPVLAAGSSCEAIPGEQRPTYWALLATDRGELEVASDHTFTNNISVPRLINQLMVLYTCTYALQLRFYCRSILCRISRLSTL